MSRTTRASAIEPLNPEEEMALIVETLAQYFIVMPKFGPCGCQRVRERASRYAGCAMSRAKLRHGQSGSHTRTAKRFK